MALPEELVKKLACPKCHQALDYYESDNRLECTACKLAYRIVNDIPVLEIDEAEELQ
jgi:hypothetical protein